jgi:hypothetical protein
VTLKSAAPAGGLTFVISSCNGSAAWPQQSTLTIAVGQTVGGVGISTNAVRSDASAQINATLGTTARWAVLTVTP